MPKRNGRDSGLMTRVAWVLLLLLLLLACLIGAGVALQRTFFPPPAEPEYTSVGPTVTQLQKLGDVTVLKLTVSDVLEGKGYGYKGAWLIKGDVLYSVDMTKAKVITKSDGSKIATISLPRPRIVSPRVDHKRTITYSVEGTNWIPGTGNQSKLRDDAMRQAQVLIEKAAEQPDNFDVARRNAELLVALMYKLVDWTVDVVWLDEEQPVAPQSTEGSSSSTK